MALAGVRKREDEEQREAEYAARFEDWINGDAETIIPQWDTVIQPEPEPEPEPEPQYEEPEPTVKPVVEPVLEELVEPEEQKPSGGYLPYGDPRQKPRETTRKEEPEPLTPAQTYDEWTKYVELQDELQETNGEEFTAPTEPEGSVFGNGYVQPVTSGSGTRKIIGEYPVGTLDYLRENDLPIDWLNTEDGQYWLEAQNQPQPETLFPTDYGTTEIPGMPEHTRPSLEQLVEGANNFLNPIMNFGVQPAVAESQEPGKPTTTEPSPEWLAENGFGWTLNPQPNSADNDEFDGSLGPIQMYEPADTVETPISPWEHLVYHSDALHDVAGKLFDEGQPLERVFDYYYDTGKFYNDINNDFKNLLGNIGYLVDSSIGQGGDVARENAIDEMIFANGGDPYDPELREKYGALIDQANANNGTDQFTERPRSDGKTREDYVQGIEDAIGDVGEVIGKGVDKIAEPFEDYNEEVKLQNEADIKASEMGLEPGTPDYDWFINFYTTTNSPEYIEEERRRKEEIAEERKRNAEYALLQEQALIDYQDRRRQYIADSRRKAEVSARRMDENYQTYLSQGYSNNAARLMAQHPELVGTIDKDGNYIGDAGLDDVLQAPPVLNPDGTPNETLQEILDNGWTIDPALLGNAEGTAEYEAVRRGNAERILHEYDNPEGGFSNVVIPDEIAKFIASGQWTANINFDETGVDDFGKLYDTSNPKNVEIVNATSEEFQEAYNIFVDANPHIKLMLEKGIIIPEDVVGHFFKGLNTKGGTKKPGSGSGYGGRYYGGGGGGGYYGGGGGYANNPNLTAKQQREQRVNNIMKNWSF